MHEDDAEVFTQALNDALDRIEETTTVYSGAITNSEAEEPENASEIADGQGKPKSAEWF